MNLELKNIKVVEKMSEETTCFHGDLFVDGVRVAYVQNTGKGGPHRYVWDSREVQVKVEAWAREEAPHCELYDYLEDNWPDCPQGFIDGLTQLVLQDQQDAAEGHKCPTKSA